MTGLRSDRSAAGLPDAGRLRTYDEVTQALRTLKIWAGGPSYDAITARVNAAWREAGRPGTELTKRATVADCFRAGRRRFNTDLVLAVVQALHADPGYVAQWRQALRVVGSQLDAAAQVRVHDVLPDQPGGFTGRVADLNHIVDLPQRHGGSAPAVAVAISGMAGVGKTQLAIRAGHLLAGANRFDRVLFVDLRGFHPDPGQPPAAPQAVLDGFLRLLGMPGPDIPSGTRARTAAYRRYLSGRRVLVVLDNAAGVEQVAPLLPEAPDSVTLITSRRPLTGLSSAAHLPLEPFTPDEATDLLTGAAPEVPIGTDPDALRRIALRCGYLPLALGLVAAKIRDAPGWSLTDHADRLDQRYRERRVDTEVGRALHLSYRHLPAERARLFRLLALHPGHDLDAYAAAALAGTDPDTAGRHLRHLREDRLLQYSTPNRFTFHDLVRAYATGRCDDEDSPSEQRAALTRLFDYHLATATAAVKTVYPARAHQQRRIRPTTAIPAMTDPDTALAWLDTERATLVAVVAHAATHDWPTHAVGLSIALYRYLFGGHFAAALSVHGDAVHAARRSGDRSGQAHALTNLGMTNAVIGQSTLAAEEFRQALHLFRRIGERTGQARVLHNLGNLTSRQGRYRQATEHLEQSLTLYREAGDREGEASALGSLGVVEERLGHYLSAARHLRQALALCVRAGDTDGEAWMSNSLGDVETRLGRYAPAEEHLERALTLYGQLGDRNGEGWTLTNLGVLHACRGDPLRATGYHNRALAMFHEIGEQDGEAYALNGLGEAALAAGRAEEAVARHTAAQRIAATTGGRDERARAQAGLGHAHRALGNVTRAHAHYKRAITLYTELSMPEAGTLAAYLDAGPRDGPPPRGSGNSNVRNRPGSQTAAPVQPQTQPRKDARRPAHRPRQPGR